MTTRTEIAANAAHAPIVIAERLRDRHLHAQAAALVHPGGFTGRLCRIRRRAAADAD